MHPEQAGLYRIGRHFAIVVTTQPRLNRNPERGMQRCSYSPHCCHLGGRAFGPPLCRGCAPATPPYKTIAHRPCVRIPAVRLQQPGCRQTNTHSDSLNGGKDTGLVKTGTVYGLVVTKNEFTQDVPRTGDFPPGARASRSQPEQLCRDTPRFYLYSEVHQVTASRLTGGPVAITIS